MRARIGLTSRGVGGPYVVGIGSALDGVDLQEAPEAGDLQPRHHLLVTVAHAHTAAASRSCAPRSALGL